MLRGLFGLRFFLFLLVIPVVNGQSRTAEYPLGTVSVRLGFFAPRIPLTLLAPVDSGLPTILYEQNVSTRMGVGVDFSQIGFYLSFNTLQPEQDENIYGLADNTDFQFHFYFKKLALDLYYQDFRGYYLSNSAEVLGAATPIVRDDMRSEFYGGSAYWIFSHDRLSIAAANAGTERQVSSGGSWLMGLGYSEQWLRSNGVLAPTGLETTYGEMGALQQGKFKTLHLSAGYAYTWVFVPKWFFHFWISIGAGPQHQDFVSRITGSVKRWAPASKGVGRFSLGYNGDTFFCAINAVNDSTGFASSGENPIQFDSLGVFTYFGMRF